MESRISTTQARELERIQQRQKLEQALSEKLGLPSLRAGNITLRDERGWRTNEKQIEYCWLINVSRSFVGRCWLFAIQFNETTFRDTHNPRELVQGIFVEGKDGSLDEFFSVTQPANFVDRIREVATLDLFDANRGIALDGVSYDFHVFAYNTEIDICVQNPNSESWRQWEDAVWEIGRALSAQWNPYLRAIFEG